MTKTQNPTQNPELITLPFAGFYESVHDQTLESALEQLFRDEQGEPTQALEKAQQILDWGQVRKAYAEKYTQYLATETGLDIRFESLHSPKEYNFATDRIFALISPDSVQKIHRETDTPNIRTLARERFTSRDGFLSFYNPDIDTWPIDTKDWDYNQLGCLLQAWLDQEHPGPESDRFCQQQELDLMEHAMCNGVLEDMLWQALPPDLQ